jgi:DNA-binding HxlR family transcriptional regulator
MRPKRFDAKSGCAVEVTLSVIGGLWKPLILFHLLGGKRRFMELARLMPNATQRMLTLQLRELESDGVVARHVFPQVPPKVEYELTEYGQSLAPILGALRDWGERYEVERQGKPSRNKGCAEPESVKSRPRGLSLEDGAGPAAL